VLLLLRVQRLLPFQMLPLLLLLRGRRCHACLQDCPALPLLLKLPVSCCLHNTCVIHTQHSKSQGVCIALYMLC
jgi:hypothetical protein